MRDPFATLLEAFDEELERFQASPAVERLLGPDLTVDHYASALREIYFYTRENPQLQASLTLALRGPRRAAVRRLLGHALDEVDHDQLALRDLEALGRDAADLPHQNPLPSTLPLVAFPVWQLQHGNPVGYLGHVFFLEFLPTRCGGLYLEALTRAGVPAEATTFLAEHAEVDEHHNRIMRHHVRQLVLDDHDLDACVYALRVSAHLYAAMLEGAFRQVDEARDLGPAVVDGVAPRGFAELPARPALPTTRERGEVRRVASVG